MGDAPRKPPYTAAALGARGAPGDTSWTRKGVGMEADKVKVTVEEVKESNPGPDGASVVVETESVVDGELRDTSIEVREADAPAVAVALLSTEASAADPLAASDLPAAVQCLAVGVVHAAGEGRVRLHLQFESGQVLPVEMSHAAAAALCRGLGEHNGSPAGQNKK